MPQRAPAKADFPPHLTLACWAACSALSHLTQGHTASGVDAWHLSLMSPLADLQRASAVVSRSSSFHGRITALLRRPIAVRVPGAIDRVRLVSGANRSPLGSPLSRRLTRSCLGPRSFSAFLPDPRTLPARGNVPLCQLTMCRNPAFGAAIALCKLHIGCSICLTILHDPAGL
jgi:hypothetical protein